MKKLTFTEVVAQIKDGEKWIGESFFIVKGEEELRIYSKNGTFGNNISGILFDNTEKFVLERKEIDFPEAFKEYLNGEEIESIFSGDRFKLVNGKSLLYDEDGAWFEYNEFSVYEICGKWYVNK